MLDLMLADLSLTALPFRTILLWSLIGTAIVVIFGSIYVNAKRIELPGAAMRSWWSKLIYALFMLSIAVLAASSFASILQVGHMEGYALLAHIGAAGAFVFLLLAFAFLFLPNAAQPGDAGFTVDGRWWLARWSLWLLVISAVVTAATMFVSMLPILDTEGLVEFAALHRFAGLVVVIAAVLNGFAMMCAKCGLR